MKTIVQIALFFAGSVLFAQISPPKPPGTPKTKPTTVDVPQPPTPKKSSSETKPADKCVSGDCTNGYGKQKFGTGYYEGFFENGLPHGPGYETYANGYYLGFYNKGKLEGFGNYGWNDTKELFRGMWKDNKREGPGYLLAGDNKLKHAGYYVNSNLSTNQGLDFINNVKNGNCTGNCNTGYGLYKWDNGDKYNGFFRDGKRVDFGSYYYPDGGVYHGQFENGSRHGQGSYLWSSGDYYIGGWSNGKRHGKGIYYFKNGDVQHGTWNNGTFVK
ncbi:MAG TPA: hypothetical protein EYN07_00620 [Flavobacteriaceae bacterium]|nr:hypothetical protein [Flavobacteriaceae bacterium]HBR53485.1 hypothetical protein [Flavobacteriaceae bacterium]HIB49560.1 hypothetical protein [Flavobacteriaceae bacterium]HIN97718.1 hypothetical protein [Flavobacteriaceae bacterium]